MAVLDVEKHTPYGCNMLICVVFSGVNLALIAWGHELD